MEIQRNHVGTWVLLFILAVESIHTIPLRQRYFLHLPSPHSYGTIYLYAIVGPLLAGLVYIVFAPHLWYYDEGSRWRYRWNPKGMAMAGFACLGMHGLDYAGFYWLFRGTPPGSVWQNIGFSVAVLAIAGFLTTTMNGLEFARERHRRRAEETLAALKEAQARLVASQMDPHTLFNVLDGVGYLIDENPEQAKTMIEATSGFLSNLLAITRTDRIPLGQERALIAEYLQVQALRMGDRLQVAWEWSEDCDAVPILPLLIQPLVENAIKHGIWPSKHGGLLSLSARREGDLLHISVANTGEPLARTSREGSTGLPNVQQRLVLAYGPAASMALRSNADHTVATLTIPVEPSPCAA